MILNIYIICLLFNSNIFAYGFECYLPEKCHLQPVSLSDWSDSNEKGEAKTTVIMCDINDDEFEFKFKEPNPLITGENCNENTTINKADNIILRWTNPKESTILDKRLNFSNVITYNRYFMYEKTLNLWGLKGFDINIADNILNSFSVYLSNSHLDFYHNKRKINSCEDIKTKINSIFQIITDHILLKNIQNMEKICPLVFMNSKIGYFTIHRLIDAFYKRKILTFSNKTYPELDSNIERLNLINVHNINIDLNFLHPSVFKTLNYLLISSGSLNSINGEVFRHLNNLSDLQIDKLIFKKINHKQGIGWIRQLNYGVNVNIKNMTNRTIGFKSIGLYSTMKNQRKRTSKIFPDEDFCIYEDFPFEQFVIIYEYFYRFHGFIEDYIYVINGYTCTYLWLIQYYKHYNTYLKADTSLKRDIIEAINTTAFKSISKCNFDQRISLCNRSNYQFKDIWDESDFFILNTKIQIAFKSSLYPILLLGLITNLIVVLVILKKENSDLFKEFKQYNYLYLNSIFCMLISLIELLSWMTECFYPFEVFCPEIRKLVAIQFFKIIFTECFVTMSRFMCNFTYIAFALNRISLIGKDHGKLVTFMSEVGIKKYIGTTLFISSLLSWIKGFKYEVNYFYPDPNFPMSNELDIIQSSSYSSRFRDFYLTFNSISDLVNYLVFVVICVIIDICMVVQLRRTLEEKAKKSELLNQKPTESKKAEFEEVVNKAIKMVVLNSTIGILFKLPVCIIPLLNTYAEFYFKDDSYKYAHVNFGEFYSMLIDSEFYSLIRDISHFSFNLSLSIQFFIYNHFDKKFLTGYERLKKSII